MDPSKVVRFPILIFPSLSSPNPPCLRLTACIDEQLSAVSDPQSAEYRQIAVEMAMRQDEKS